MILRHDGNEELARKDWNAAKRNEHFFDVEFASCPRGHLLHAKCLQKAMIGGLRCPAPDCMEQIFLPRVTRETPEDDDICCGRTDQNEEEDALHAASDLTIHSSSLEARAYEQNNEGNATRAVFSENSLKMCPMCCAGPLFNQECSDMTAHHGQCSMKALKVKTKLCRQSTKPHQFVTLRG